MSISQSHREALARVRAEMFLKSRVDISLVLTRKTAFIQKVQKKRIGRKGCVYDGCFWKNSCQVFYTESKGHPKQNPEVFCVSNPPAGTFSGGGRNPENPRKSHMDAWRTLKPGPCSFETSARPKVPMRYPMKRYQKWKCSYKNKALQTQSHAW